MYRISTKAKLPENIRAERVTRVTNAQQNAMPSKREKYPFAKLEVGQSFFVSDAKSLKTLNGSMYSASTKYGRKFVSRQVIERGKTGVRVWRVQ